MRAVALPLVLLLVACESWQPIAPSELASRRNERVRLHFSDRHTLTGIVVAATPDDVDLAWARLEGVSLPQGATRTGISLYHVATAAVRQAEIDGSPGLQPWQLALIVVGFAVVSSAARLMRAKTCCFD